MAKAIRAAAPKPKKMVPILEDEEVPEEYNYDYTEGNFYDGIFHGPKKDVCFNWRLPCRRVVIPTDTPKTLARREAKGNVNAEDEELKVPYYKCEGKMMKLAKRMNKSPSSEVSKERTRMLKESRQEAMVYHQIVD